MAMADLERARERCNGPMQFVVEGLEAWEQIVECRRVLKWSYAYGYYLEGQSEEKMRFFEYLQGQAEAELERLHHFVEMEIEAEGVYVDHAKFRVFRVKLWDLIRVTSNYFKNLVVALEKNLVQVESSRNKKRVRSPEKVQIPNPQRRRIRLRI